MASGQTVYMQDLIADWYRGTAMPTAPTTLTIALSTVSIDDDGANIAEPSGANGYARQTITLTAPVHTEGAGTRVANAAPIVFGPVTNATWGTLVAAAVYHNNGSMLFKGDFAAPRSAPVGDTISFGIETIEFKVK